MVPMLSNGSRGTLMSYTDHSAQRRLKSNALIQSRGIDSLGVDSPSLMHKATAATLKHRSKSLRINHALCKGKSLT